MVFFSAFGGGLYLGAGQALAVGGRTSLLILYILLSALVYCMTIIVSPVAFYDRSRHGTLSIDGFEYTY